MVKNQFLSWLLNSGADPDDHFVWGEGVQKESRANYFADPSPQIFLFF